MSAGKLIAWRKKPGDSVTRGEIIADVETDKADIEVEVFTSGVIEKFLVEPGEKVPVGTILAIIREVGATTPAQPARPVEIPLAATPPPMVRSGEPRLPQAAGERGERKRISPAAKKLATELGIDVTSLVGTGPAGRIVREDVEQAAAARSTERPTGKVTSDRQARMRQVIASAMARSKREIPHYYLSTTVDMSSALSWLTQDNLTRPMEDRLLYGVLLIKAVALALRQFPELNGFWLDGKAAPSSDIHIGVAISLRGGGLVAPALHNADQKTLGELMRSFRDLATRARALSLRSSELTDPTITVTSLGEQGVEMVFPIIYPPQVCIVGFGKVVEKPWSAQGQLVSRPVIVATVAADHRVSDGHRGALFLAAVDRLLQKPNEL